MFTVNCHNGKPSAGTLAVSLADVNRKQNVNNSKKEIMSNFYCEYCGTKSSSISSLTANSCHRHPLGSGKGKHKLYEGSEKTKYSCKYCGTSSSTISSLTSNSCHRHPNGTGKGKHAPTL